MLKIAGILFTIKVIFLGYIVELKVSTMILKLNWINGILQIVTLSKNSIPTPCVNEEPLNLDPVS